MMKRCPHRPAGFDEARLARVVSCATWPSSLIDWKRDEPQPIGSLHTQQHRMLVFRTGLAQDSAQIGTTEAICYRKTIRSAPRPILLLSTPAADATPISTSTRVDFRGRGNFAVLWAL
jgi:hypothetical protein